MTNDISMVVMAIKESDLVSPTVAQSPDYILGQIVTVRDGSNSSKAIKRFMYVKSHAGLTAYVPYAINYGSTSGAEVVTKAVTTLAAPGFQIGVPQVAFTSGYYGFIQIEGDASVLMKAETYAIGDFLEVTNAVPGTASVDGSTGATARTPNSFAISKAAGTTSVAKSVYLLGLRTVVASS